MLKTLALLLALVASACGTTGLAFVTDDRVEITSPRDRAVVRLPLDVTWTARDFVVSGSAPDAQSDAGSFGIFVDQAPQPPGETFRWFARNDRTCRASDGCPDERYLSDRGIYRTSETRFRIDLLPRTVPEEQQRREFHELTVVLLDGAGRRVGESAWFVEFQVERDED